MMARTRRQLLGLIGASAVSAVSAVAHAQDWAPSRPVRIVVPVQGTTNDVLARLVAPRLGDALGQPVVVENKPGAGGNIGADFVAKQPADGHTLLVGYNGPLAINPTLFDKLPYDPVKDFAPITLAVRAAQYLVVNPRLGISTVQDLVSKAKADPNRYSYGSIAVGSASHLTMEMLKEAAGISVTHVPYKGAGPAVTDLIAGQIQLGFFVPGNVQQFARSGQLRLIASTGTRRFPSTPDVPTLAESGFPGFEATSWIGFLAPGGTPRNIVERYHREIVKILRSPEVQARLQEMEFEVVAGTPEQFAGWIRSEIPKWGRIIRSTGAKAE
jgi:tripartite-type tricarboxylate transporter receptor subunit TctC